MPDRKRNTSNKAQKSQMKQRSLFEMLPYKAGSANDTATTAQEEATSFEPHAVDPVASISSASATSDRMSERDSRPVAESSLQDDSQRKPLVDDSICVPLSDMPPTFSPLASTSTITAPPVAVDIEDSKDGTSSENAIDLSTSSPVTTAPSSSYPGSRSEPIDLELSPPLSSLPKPKNGVYSIFNHKAPRSELPEPTSSSAITSTSSTVSSSSKPSHPFFLPRTAGPKRLKELDPPALTFSTHHVSGPQNSFSSSSDHRFPKRQRTTISDNDDRWKVPVYKHHNTESKAGTAMSTTHTAPSPDECENFLRSMPEDQLKAHPVLSHVLDTSIHRDKTMNSLWTHRWRPTKAEHVLGNEQNALYLRDWLKAQSLELDVNGVAQSPVKKQSRAKRKQLDKRTTSTRVIRAVVKKRGRKRQRFDSEDEEDWIADSDESVEFESELDDQGQFLGREPKSSHNRGTNKFPHLTNTILLHGPVGSGKTSAVYACAEELGWDVFEVYPGIGRRNGANLDSLVGDVGKNHIVGKAQLYRGGEGSFLRTPVDSTPSPVQALGSPSFIHSTDFGFLRSLPEEHDSRIRQSLILLEEVDILYKQDQGFWPAVVNLIRDCKRPVICTCNELALVPVVDLPLQTTLFFASPAPTSVGTYLRAVSFLEGLHGRENDAAQGISTGNSETGDLRRALHQLQSQATFPSQLDLPLPDWSQASYSIADAGKAPFPRRERQYIQLLSDLDCMLPTMHALVEGQPSEDDELGYSILWETPNTLQSGGFGQKFNSEGNILLTAIREAQRQVATSPNTPRAADRSNLELMNHLRVVAQNDVFPGTVAAFMSPDLHLDYLPFVRQISAVDDVHELLESEGLERLPSTRLRRSTRRNGGNIGYVRTVLLTAEERVGLETTQLRLKAGEADARGDEFTVHVSLSVDGRKQHKVIGFPLVAEGATRRVWSRMAPASSLSKELAPLEVLQSTQHRRGSITDPSLHTASSYNLKTIMNHHLDPKSVLQDPRPSAGYVFGNATPRPHSPSNSTIDPLKTQPAYTHPRDESFPESDDLSDLHAHHPPLPGSRRPSLAHHTPGAGGTKRKMSSDRSTLSESIDPLMSSPGFQTDPDAPPVKRRGSAVDTHKISMLSLEERRPSIPGQWWSATSMNGERRDSTSSIFSSMSYASSPGSAAWSPSQSDSRQLEPEPHTPSSMLPPDRRMSVPEIRSPAFGSALGPGRRERSRPPSTDVHAVDERTMQKAAKDALAASPYSRSPELRVSHKLAERKRRAEMKDLFEDLKDQLPTEKGMKASKWEILSKSIDLVVQLKQTNASQAQEIEALKRELAIARGLPPAPTPTYGPGIPPSTPVLLSSSSIPAHSISRPPSSQDMFSVHHRSAGPE